MTGETERFLRKALTWLVPLTDITGDPDPPVTVVSLEEPATVRAGDFYLAKGISGETLPYRKEKIDDAMMPAD
jgi:hypothetical protein